MIMTGHAFKTDKILSTKIDVIKRINTFANSENIAIYSLTLSFIAMKNLSYAMIYFAVYI